MANKKRRAVIILLLLIAAVVAAMLILRFYRRGNPNVISVSGNIELTEVNISFKVSGKLVQLNVDEGDPVKRGMVVARLDHDELIRQREKASAGLASSQSQLVELKTQIAYQRQQLEEEIKQRQAELAQAEANLRDLLAGSRPQEIKESAASVDQARTEYQTAKKDWDRGSVAAGIRRHFRFPVRSIQVAF